MKYQFCRKCGGETVHETIAFNNIPASRQDLVTRCKECHTTKDVKSTPIYPADAQRLRKTQY